jgi:flagellar biosynthetic protein FliP
MIKKNLQAILVLILLFSCEAAAAADLTMSLNDNAASASGGFSSRIIQIIALMTILSVAPSIVIMFTSFTKIAVVLSILRNGLGLQQTPPNSVLASLALFLTFFIMEKPLKAIYDDAIEPLMEERITNECQAL